MGEAIKKKIVLPFISFYFLWGENVKYIFSTPLTIELFDPWPAEWDFALLISKKRGRSFSYGIPITMFTT
jgi:hypothetical protein